MIGVLQFPGSCDERDAVAACERVGEAKLVWHEESDLSGLDAIVVPGGFSYGDYLRAGAIARFSGAMEAVARFAADGGPVLGICNGFQVLCEAGLLPGALLRNRDLHFVCDFVHVRVERAGTPFTSRARSGQVLRLPVKHGEGAYHVRPEELARLEASGQIVLRYCGPDGRPAADANPNGAVGDVAGVCNARGNVFGLMPHPEHAVEPAIGGVDGLVILGSLLDAVKAGAARAGG